MTPIASLAAGRVCGLPSMNLARVWKRWLPGAAAALAFCGAESPAGEPPIEQIRLPPLRIQGQAARAHTQGLELAGGGYYVTARQEDVRPKRAILLRPNLATDVWDIWAITPMAPQGVVTALDHPGGMQSDGTRLWIPLAESKRAGRSVICAFLLTNCVGGRQLKPDFEFPVADHIGAVAVAANRQLLFGASWDTERVYVWDLRGRLQRTLAGIELPERALGVVAGAQGRAGLAVQDWKFVGDRLFASGLFRSPGSAAGLVESRLSWFTDFLEPKFQRWTVTLPMQKGVLLAREAMAISDGLVHFLPEDLGASNRLFRVALTDLFKQNTVR